MQETGVRRGEEELSMGYRERDKQNGHVRHDGKRKREMKERNGTRTGAHAQWCQRR